MEFLTNVVFFFLGCGSTILFFALTSGSETPLQKARRRSRYSPPSNNSSSENPSGHLGSYFPSKGYDR